LGVSYRLLYALAFRPILNKIGLDQLRLVLCGGAPLPPETMALWHVYGVNVSELYGQTETTGALITGQAAHFPRPGNIGKPPAGWEVVLSPENEILVKSADLFDGYWNRPDATREVIDDDGWLHTGDIGEWADGNLRIIDRAKDIIVTSGGKTLSPTFIENILRSSLYISEAIVFGHERPYVSALLEIDYDTVSDWARSHDVTYTGFTNLTEQPQVLDLLGREVDRANEELGRVEQIKSFRVLPKELDPEEEGEPVTPTRKVKRKLMYERFQDLVDSMYGQDEARLIASGIGDMLGNGENAGADGLNKAL
jgi:long-chain acyl-CoA synthetase